MKNIMMMRICNLKIKLTHLCVGVIFILIYSCTGMDETYKEFWSDGEIIYPGIPDSVEAYSGENRIKLQWLLYGDASVEKAKVYWNLSEDTLEYDVSASGGVDTISIIVPGLDEGYYVFYISHIDDEGNSSLEVSATGQAYGENYRSIISNRSVESFDFENNSLEIEWSTLSDDEYIGSILKYVDTLGVSKQLYIENDAETTNVSDYDSTFSSGIFSYCSGFLPDTTAIDTFYTSYDDISIVAE